MIKKYLAKFVLTLAAVSVLSFGIVATVYAEERPGDPGIIKIENIEELGDIAGDLAIPYSSRYEVYTKVMNGKRYVRIWDNKAGVWVTDWICINN